jgi:hypothetical protein
MQSVEIGDEIVISGMVDEYFDKTEITDIINMTVLGTADIPAPEVITTSDLTSSEEYESVLVQVQNVTVTNEDLGNGEWEIDDGSGPCIVGHLGDYTYIPVLDDFIYSITGVSDFTYSAFKLEPRDDDDINLLGLAIEPLELNFMTIENCLDGLEFTISNLSNSAIEIISIEETGMFPISGNPWNIEDFNLSLPYDLGGGEVLTFNVVVGLTTENNREIVSDILEIESELGITNITLNFDTDVNSDAEDNLINTSSELIGNYPNPFNPITAISFSLTAEDAENAEIIIYNIKGQKVKTLVDEKAEAGINSVIWNGTNENNQPVTSGIYFYKLNSAEKSLTKKMLLLK